MATIGLKKILDNNVWQSCVPSPTVNAANMVTADSMGPDQISYYLTATTGVLSYDPNEDGWVSLPSPALGTFAAGAAAQWHPNGPSGTATAGSTSTTLNTNLTILGDLSSRNGLSFKVRITGGTGAGQERLITSATYGANSVITVSSEWSVTPNNTSTYILYTGRVYFLGGGTLAAASFKHWDYATQTWSGNLSITGLPASFGTDSRLVGTNSTFTNVSFTGTATSGSTTTLVNSAKTWTVNQFANWQVRIVAGSGAGGIRLITSNTSTTLTIATGTAIDNTSEYVIEPADDYLYLMGNAAVTLYRYSVSGNSWVTRTPTTARGGAAAAGVQANWIHGVTLSTWNNESSILNGNRIYSFRGGAATLDYYDIGLNTWVNAVVYGKSGIDFPASGADTIYDGKNSIYIQLAQAAALPTRFVKLDLRGPVLEAFSTNLYPSNTAATLGAKMWTVQYYDGSGDTITFIYHLIPGGTALYRCIIW
jgi:hypothetical protein